MTKRVLWIIVCIMCIIVLLYANKFMGRSYHAIVEYSALNYVGQASKYY